MGVIYTGNGEDGDEALSQLSTRMKQEVRADGSPSFTPIIAYTSCSLSCFTSPVSRPSSQSAVKLVTGSGDVFSALYSCGIAWLICFVVYQTARLLG